MQFEEKLDVIEEDIAQYSRELLDILLKDRTTNENIIWATSDYISHGELYAATEQIYASLITGVHSKLIQPRVAKAHEQKNSRTRDKAEVFTPSWICNAQNNLVDEHWFGRPNVFNIQQDSTWTATERVVFSEDKQHTWKHYVDTLVKNGTPTTIMRNLNDFDVLIREPMLANIVKKVMANSPRTVSEIISGDTPFGIPTNPKESKKHPITVYATSSDEHNTKLFHIESTKRKTEYINRSAIKKNSDAIDAEKVFIPKGYGAGETFPHQILGVPEYGGSNSVCSQSYLYAAFDSKSEAENFISYLKTKFFRALVLAVKISQDAMSKTYRFVPMQDFSKPWTDAELYEKYALTDEEITFIESMIKPME